MDRYAVIGNPIAHSKSPQIHAAFARQTGQDLSYEHILAPVDGFRQAVLDFREQGGKGLSVTLPFKLQAFDLSTKRSERAQAARAVNFLRLDENEIAADNTDGVGLVNDIERNLGFPIRAKRVLVVGAGGAGQGIVYPLLEAAASELTLANRTKDKALVFVRSLWAGMRVPRPIVGCGLDELAGAQFDLIVNATSSSISGAAPALPPRLFAPRSLAYELMYGQSETAFLRFARENGAERLSDGLGMLVEQAAEAFYLWRGVRPASAPVLAAMRDALAGTR